MRRKIHLPESTRHFRPVSESTSEKQDQREEKLITFLLRPAEIAIRIIFE